MLEYKIFKANKKGFLTSRHPETVENELNISFLSAPKKATAIFENGNGVSIYRDIKSGVCTIPKSFLDGKIKVAVVVMDSSDNDKYLCEEIYTERKQDIVFVCPNGIDTPVMIIEILSKFQEIFEGIDKLDKKQNGLEKRMDKLVEGYDFD